MPKYCAVLCAKVRTGDETPSFTTVLQNLFVQHLLVNSYLERLIAHRVCKYNSCTSLVRVVITPWETCAFLLVVYEHSMRRVKGVLLYFVRDVYTSGVAVLQQRVN